MQTCVYFANMPMTELQQIGSDLSRSKLQLGLLQRRWVVQVKGGSGRQRREGHTTGGNAACVLACGLAQRLSRALLIQDLLHRTSRFYLVEILCDCLLPPAPRGGLWRQSTPVATLQAVHWQDGRPQLSKLHCWMQSMALVCQQM